MRRLAYVHEIAFDSILPKRWRQRAADGGDARAANNLGWIYASGTGLEKDSAAAAGWYLRAAGEGLPAGAWNLVALLEEQPSLQPADSVIAPVYRLLGESFSRGQGVPYSYRRSLEYYLRGAAYGDERSELVLTELLGQMPDALTILPLDSLSAAWGRPLPLP